MMSGTGRPHIAVIRKGGVESLSSETSSSLSDRGFSLKRDQKGYARVSPLEEPNRGVPTEPPELPVPERAWVRSSRLAVARKY
jgi:hypothetical protein